MKHTATLAALLAAPLLSAAPIDAGDLPAETKWFLHFDVENAVGTELGQAVIHEIKTKHGEHLQNVTNFLGMDPLTDLHGMTLSGDGTPNKAALIVRGDYDRDRLLSMLDGARNHEVVKHGDHEIHTWVDHGNSKFGVFYDEQTIVMSDFKEEVTTTVKTLDGEHESLPANSLQEDMISGVLAAGVELDLETFQVDPKAAAIVGKAEQIHMSFSERNGLSKVHFRMIASDSKDAPRMAEVSEGMINLALLADPIFDLGGLQYKVSSKGAEVNTVITAPSLVMLALAAHFN